MKYLIKNAAVYTGGKIQKKDLIIDGGIVTEIGSDLQCDGAVFINFSGKHIFPGFTDVHVHFREPGFSYKETIKSGSAAAAAGGYTTVCTMPNLNPVPDCMPALQQQLDIIRRDSCIRVLPFGAITMSEKGEKLADMQAMAPFVAGFSDDGRGVQNGSMMLDAMKTAKKLGKIISAHCEVNELLNGGYIHDGEYCKAHGHRGISSESEWRQIERDIELCRQTGCAYHVCHISTKESVQLIRKAKLDGVNISCETAPHYLALDDSCLIESGSFKMNPPLRSKADKEALLEGIADGTIDCIATDHAPHSAEEKAKGLAGSLMGITGLETAFPVCYTELVKTGIISLEQLLKLLIDKPNARFNIGGEIEIGSPANLTVFDLNEEFAINPAEFKSKGKSTPFDGKKAQGRCLMTMRDGEIIYKRKE